MSLAHTGHITHMLHTHTYTLQGRRLVHEVASLGMCLEFSMKSRPVQVVPQNKLIHSGSFLGLSITKYSSPLPVCQEPFWGPMALVLGLCPWVRFKIRPSKPLETGSSSNWGH